MPNSSPRPACSERELLEAGRLADHVDLGDPPLLDPQPQHSEQPPAGRDDDSRHPVHKRDLGGLRHLGEPPGLLGHRTGTADLGRHPEASIGSANRSWSAKATRSAGDSRSNTTSKA
jgi:hypothetical protein